MLKVNEVKAIRVTFIDGTLTVVQEMRYPLENGTKSTRQVFEGVTLIEGNINDDGLVLIPSEFETESGLVGIKLGPYGLQFEQREIKRCPFCGDSDVVIGSGQDAFEKPVYEAQCHRCTACGPRATTKAGAIKSWNRRCNG